MANKPWTSVYPGAVDSDTNMPALVNGVDLTNATQAEALKTSLIAAENAIGTLQASSGVTQGSVGDFLLVGDGGTILRRSTDGSYAAQTSGTTNNLNAIFAVPGGKIHAAGLGVYLTSEDGGTTWSNITATVGLAVDELVNQIHATGPSNIVVSTRTGSGDGRVLQFNGTAWADLYPTTDPDLDILGCYTFAPDNVWASHSRAGNDAIRQYVTSWTEPGGTGAAGRFFGLDTDNFRLCSRNDNTSTHDVYVWNGTTWVLEFNEATSGGRPVMHGLSSDYIWSAGDDNSSDRFRAFFFDGTSWSTNFTTTVINTAPGGIFAIGPTAILAACDTGNAFFYDGTAWTNEGPGTTGTSNALNGVCGVPTVKHLVGASPDDTVPGFLSEKLVAGTGVTLTPGGTATSKTITVASTAAPTFQQDSFSSAPAGITSNTFVDTGLEVIVNTSTTNQVVEIEFSGAIKANGDFVWLVIDVGGVQTDGAVLLNDADWNPVHMLRRITLATAGAHTIKVQGRRNGSNTLELGFNASEEVNCFLYTRLYG